ncbi:hypothetical protein QYM36_009104 [Artemia franciscana]|uniref:Inositol oxygenase n=2 Tax=Artemia franciscana TaxID=6661 RepID=A0AA88I3N7_ARTSF|nr:hypothetical protein QYM36_009104 [Artemia franciscana]KAK2714772.1 hypothetical protein QYM36_009104 [Artemia franciscana]KAK2714773.1 hypothetical protein QYM36_009104 [Artemia franciscana]
MRVLLDFITDEDGKVRYIDPSELLRPEVEFSAKPIETFRDYTVNDEDPLRARVRKIYYDMHTNQTVEFVREKMSFWCQFNHFKATILEALELLNSLVDESDPDVDIPNIVHAFQTAERLRMDYPQYDWLHLTGLIHDLGKVLALQREPQWAVVGDTFPVGCAYSEDIVYGVKSFKDNPDSRSSIYSSKLGIYERHCGLSNVLMSWGHDEYMYQVLRNNGTTLPKEALAIIRFHSFYPWHTNDAYEHLCNDEDIRNRTWVKIFKSHHV